MPRQQNAQAPPPQPARDEITNTVTPRPEQQAQPDEGDSFWLLLKRV